MFKAKNLLIHINASIMYWITNKHRTDVRWIK